MTASEADPIVWTPVTCRESDNVRARNSGYEVERSGSSHCTEWVDGDGHPILRDYDNLVDGKVRCSHFVPVGTR